MLVTDVDSEGYLFAFLLSNRIDEVVFNVLLEQIKICIGNVLPKTIMSYMYVLF